jgi:spermidine synthase
MAKCFVVGLVRTVSRGPVRGIATSASLGQQDNRLQCGFSQNYFHEVNRQWKGIACSIECEEILFDEKSDYQHVQVFRSSTFGNVLILDGVIQLTTRDEMAYQEMITHLPLFAHPNPKRVCIVGAGDGGVLREVVKHEDVEEIIICEIDKMVIECGKKFFPSVSTAWDDPRVTFVCGDASQYIDTEENKERFDVIICDSSDPEGPAEVLFEPPFFRAMHQALRAGGRISTQAESMWLHLPLIQKLVAATSLIFPEVEYATTQIPTYPAGQIGLLQLQKAGDATTPTSSPIVPARTPAVGMELSFYTPELHAASFVLPKFAVEAINQAKSQPQAASS